METTWEASKMAPFRQGVQAGVAIAIGYTPIALAFGLLAKTTGLMLGETVLMSLVVFAGASQYIALSLIAAGTGALEIVLTTFILILSARLFFTCRKDGRSCWLRCCRLSSFNGWRKKEETAMNSTIVWMIIGMGVVTYLPRLLPFVLLGRIQLPPFWQGVLKNVPYAVLGALIIPDVFFIQDDVVFGAIGFAAAVIAAWFRANVMVVVLAAVAVLSLYSLVV